ncbi:hypothetical protein CANCADRAFT_55782 [Tortispora caseinolytica NRRL Y-17796]|uniref:protein-tyrosine-phosphatase n=1 Tax=Tortispora caseinolytica NRRL Y-17796 TaxID=767744 RepID=A0A1E4TK41_9ASCO|nr:hypothetical protein CANCADRAFT_55782 [Tortispora caseinolytica NRRL Y-17796]
MFSPSQTPYDDDKKIATRSDYGTLNQMPSSTSPLPALPSPGIRDLEHASTIDSYGYFPPSDKTSALMKEKPVPESLQPVPSQDLRVNLKPKSDALCANAVAANTTSADLISAEAALQSAMTSENSYSTDTIERNSARNAHTIGFLGQSDNSSHSSLPLVPDNSQLSEEYSRIMRTKMSLAQHGTNNTVLNPNFRNSSTYVENSSDPPDQFSELHRLKTTGNTCITFNGKHVDRKIFFNNESIRITALSSRQTYSMLKDGKSTLLIDLRPLSRFLAGHIKTAINICMPSTLLRRNNVTADSMLATVSHSSRTSAHDPNWMKSEIIILYDTEARKIAHSSLLYAVASKFRRSGYTGTIAYLIGGYAMFSRQYPDMIEGNCSDNTTDNDISVHPAAAYKRSFSAVDIADTEHAREQFSLHLDIPEHESSASPDGLLKGLRINTPVLKLEDNVNEFFLHYMKPHVFTPQKKDYDMVESRIKQFSETHCASFKRVCEILHTETEYREWAAELIEKFQMLDRIEQQRLRQVAPDSAELLDKNAPGRPRFSVSSGIQRGDKNRYANILPYEYTRVILSGTPGQYINASTISIAQSDMKFIATQAPLDATLDEFWKMIWENEVHVIVMLSGDLERTSGLVYWNSKEYSAFRVSLVSETKARVNDRDKRKLGMKDYGEEIFTKREISLEHKESGTVRKIVHVHYSCWADSATARSAEEIVELVDSCFVLWADNKTPTVVHCSAGCGRTGTFCTVAYAIEYLRSTKAKKPWVRSGSCCLLTDSSKVAMHEKYRDDFVYDIVSQLRNERFCMVETLSQYTLCYEVITAWIAGQRAL